MVNGGGERKFAAGASVRARGPMGEPDIHYPIKIPAIPQSRDGALFERLALVPELTCCINCLNGWED